MNHRGRGIRNLDVELLTSEDYSYVQVIHWTPGNEAASPARSARMTGTASDCESVYEWLCDTLTAGRHPFEACGQLIVTTVTDK